jgi:hypothetical protein
LAYAFNSVKEWVCVLKIFPRYIFETFRRAAVPLLVFGLFGTIIRAFCASPDVTFAPYMAVRLLAVDEQTNVYAHAGGTVIRLNPGMVPFQTNNISPVVGDYAQRDAAGNFYFIGPATGPHDFGGGVVLSNGPYAIAKYTDAGVLLYARDFGTSGGFADIRRLDDLQVDAASGVAYTADSVGIHTAYKYSYLHRFDAAGNITWTAFLPDPYSYSSFNVRTRIGPVTANGGYATTFVTDTSLGIVEAVLSHFDSNGVCTVIASWDTPINMAPTLARTVANSSGDLWNFEAFGGLYSPQNMRLTKRSADGTILLTNVFPLTNLWTIGADKFGGAHVGSDAGPFSRYDADGNLAWTLPWVFSPVNVFILDSSGNRFFSLSVGSLGRIGDEPLAAPSISSNPQSQTVMLGSNVVLSVGAAGSGPLRYQWQFAGNSLSGETNNSINLAAVGLAQGGVYSVVVSNFVGAVTSAPALLRVKQVEWFSGSQLLTNGTYNLLSTASISLRSTFVNGSSFYTLDGSAPSFASIPYSGPFELSNSATLRAIGYSADFSQNEQADVATVNMLANYTLSATTAGGGGISLYPPGGIYASTNIVTATATPSNGWTFLYWQGDASGVNPVIKVSTDRDKSIQAVFGTTLSTTVAGSGQVLVYPPVALYPYGSVARLTGVPQPGNVFGIWGNAASGNTNPLNFAVTSANPTVSSLFVSTPPGNSALTVLISGNGQVDAIPRANYYATGQPVTLTATAAFGESFLGWSGDAGGTQNPLTITMSQDRMITARFSGPITLRADPGAGDGLSEQGFRFRLLSPAFGAFQIFASTNLSSWQFIGTVTNNAGDTPFTDPGALGQPMRFYRASPD